MGDVWMNAPLVAVLFAILATREPPRTGVAIKDPSPRESYVEFWRYRGVIVRALIGEAMIGIALGAPMIGRRRRYPATSVFHRNALARSWPW